MYKYCETGFLQKVVFVSKSFMHLGILKWSYEETNSVLENGLIIVVCVI